MDDSTDRLGRLPNFLASQQALRMEQPSLSARTRDEPSADADSTRPSTSGLFELGLRQISFNLITCSRMTARRPFGPRFVAFFAPFALLLLLPGVVELHAPGFEHSTAAESAGSAVAFFPAAEHPNQPLHVEPAQEAVHEPCAACLHRLETRGGAPAARIESATPAVSGSLYLGRSVARRAGLASPTRGRAPPSFLV